MAAAIACRKRAATPFLDEVTPAPPHLAKRGRFSPCPGAAAAQRPPLAVDPLDALRRVFPDAGPGELEACFAASGRDVHATVEACRARQRQAREREATAARVASAAARADGGGMEECAGVLVEQMSAAADVADARGRASLILKLVESAVASRAAAAAEAQAAALREENAALKARAEELERDNGVLRCGVAAQHRRQEELERDNGVLKRGVATLHRRQEEAERAAEELKKKVAELAAANYALGVQARGADSCRFQVFRGPDVF
ncbi:hypothetical protein PAHAL_1G020200 [Panicum hallii]|jgi:hypothetical protein|uniref:CUE domain-containing protein n=1 Tax=Panicum hallii TaxID=206008 RepID=A0A2S3GKU7_9POAL|nr:uncharacterized abhydrolase domain-containing protein DDB_G0269086-like [Panicum hallii]PAN03763.2 hypothetical protein PAHAL_1G020200 [Panicum hallii]